LITGRGKVTQYGNASTSVKGKVSDYFLNGNWNCTKLRNDLPDELVSHILGITIKLSNLPDQPIWRETTDGKFSRKSAWNVIREHQSTSLFRHKNSPFKVAFFLWRLLKHKVTVDSNMGRFGLNIPSKCSCCTISRQEDGEHSNMDS